MAAFLATVVFTAGLAAAGAAARGAGAAESVEGFKEEYESVKAMVDKAEEMKGNDHPGFKGQVMGAFRASVALYKKHKTSAEVIFLVARCYYYNDRASKASRSIEKVLYYNPVHSGALTMRADILADGIGADLSGSVDPLLEFKKAIKAYKAALASAGDEGGERVSRIYLKMGDLYKEVRLQRKKAREYWEKAVSAAPGSEASVEAKERLAGTR